MTGVRIIEKIFHASHTRGGITFIPLIVPGFPNPETFAKARDYVYSIGIRAIETIWTVSPCFSPETGYDVRMVAAKYGSMNPQFIADSLKSFRPRLCVVFGRVAWDRREEEIHRLSSFFDGFIFDSPWFCSEDRIRLTQRFGVAFIPVISLNSPSRQTWNALRGGSGFVYLMCSASTGGDLAKHDEISKVIATIKRRTPLPVCCAFGIKTSSHIRIVRRAGADGVIVGTGLLQALQHGIRAWKSQLSKMKDACASVQK